MSDAFMLLYGLKFVIKIGDSNKRSNSRSEYRLEFKNFLLPVLVFLYLKPASFHPVNKRPNLQIPIKEATGRQYQKYYTMHSIASYFHRLTTPLDLLTDPGLRGE